MSFLVAGALAVALLVIAPVLAHLLRRSRADEREFPPAKLVPVAEPVARQRSRLEDRALLLVRALTVLGLAVLGATPFVRCSRLAIARQAGGSVALALVVDDSLSMRAKTTSGPTRFELAKSGARDLLDTTREGDAVALVLAGAPARLALSATTDLGAVRHALAELAPSDRSTDIEGAVQLARTALKQLPHTDRRVVLLSDFAGNPVPAGEPPAWAPLAALRAPVDDCGVVSAETRGRRASATIACSSARAARGRSLELVASAGSEPGPADAGTSSTRTKAGDLVASVKLEPHAGEQTVVSEIDVASVALDARLSGKDAIAHDDEAPVSAAGSGLLLGVLTDPATSSATTGGSSVLEQALGALEEEVTLRPMSVLPDDDKDLAPLAALILDDPTGLTPETRAALSTWVERGGVAAAWLGPRAESVQLGSTLEPFVTGPLRWEHTRAKGLDPASIGWLGAPGTSLSNLEPRGRARLEGALPSGARVTARWDDGQPFLAEMAFGRGLLITTGLPVSVDQSDVALRPGFLALLDELIDRAARRVGPRRTLAGVPWTFAGASKLSVEGPDGALRVSDSDPGATSAQKTVLPAVLGRYRVSVDGAPEVRVVTIDPKEITTPPREPESQPDRVVVGGVANKTDVSREVALGLLALFLLELVLRTLRRVKPRRGRRRSDRTTVPG